MFYRWTTSAIVVGAISVNAAAEILHVNKSVAGGIGDGSSWENAFVHLRDALAASQNDDEIWVAQGVYYSDEGEEVGPYVHAFAIWKKVKLYGGFDGTETCADQRDPYTQPTILSGDVDQDDVNLDGNRVNETASDIRGTNASNVIMFEGGRSSELTLDGFIVTGGDAATQTRTGLAGTIGGALYIRDGDSVITGCRFSGNRSLQEAGAVRVARGNQAFTSCIFSGNRAGTTGGALQTAGQNRLALHNCVFLDNVAESGSGGAILGAVDSITNCTFLANSCEGEGGGAYLGSKILQINNTIFWGNTSSTSTIPSSRSAFSLRGNATFSHCIIEHSTGAFGAGPDFSLGVDGGGNLDTDPRFFGPLGSPGSYFLAANSPAIDAGLKENVTEVVDVVGRPRLAGDQVDIGAYESHHDELDSDRDGLSDGFELAHTSPPSSSALNPLDDLDFDGLLNLLEFAFGRDPREPERIPPLLISPVSDSDRRFLAASYPLSFWAAHHLEVFVERSTDLGRHDDWSRGESTFVEEAVLGPLTSRVTVRSRFSIDTQPAEQLRVRVRRK